MDRPQRSNADEWELFLVEHEGATAFVAVQIAEAIEQAERDACERAIKRMGWPEIHAFEGELKRGQSIFEDAGGFMLRAIRRLFGLKRIDEVVNYQEAARSMMSDIRTGEKG